MKHYDALIIGAGGGTKLVKPVVDLGLKVALIEKEAPGGTCLNRGCIPSKMLIYPADVTTLIRESEKFELHLDRRVTCDFKALVERISRTIDQDSQSLVPRFQAHPRIDYYPYDSRFVEERVLQSGDDLLTADKIFIAVGARPHVPSIPGLRDTPFMTSREALRNIRLPRKLLVLGGGYIACELGHAYGALGSEVHFLVRSGLLKNEDPDVAEAFGVEFGKRHHVHLEVVTERVDYDGSQFTVTCRDANGQPQTHQGDALLVATGVTPNSDTLGLEKTGIRTRKGGFIQVDDHLQTTVPGVYALGDVVGNYLFRHSVNFEGEYLFENLFQGKPPQPIRYPPMPHAVFTHPQIAGVGQTEAELRKQGIDYVVGMNPYSASAMGMARLSDHGFVKLLFERSSRRLLGAHILGEEAATLLHQFIYCMTLQGTLDDLLGMIYIHPAMPEIARNACRKAKSALDQAVAGS